MAELNINTATAGYLKRVQLALGDTAMHELVVCASDSAVIIDSLYVANSTATEKTVTVDCYDNSATSNVDVLTNGAVPGDCSLVVIDAKSPVYLEEGDKLRVQAGTSSVLSAVVSYRVMS